MTRSVCHYDERAILEHARARRIDLTSMRDFWIQQTHGRVLHADVRA